MGNLIDNKIIGNGYIYLEDNSIIKGYFYD